MALTRLGRVELFRYEAADPVRKDERWREHRLLRGGRGTPFIEARSPSNIQLEFRDWEWHRIMAARRRLIRYDCRGSGLSQRDVTDWSVEAMALDIGAVADALEQSETSAPAALPDLPAEDRGRDPLGARPRTRGRPLPLPVAGGTNFRLSWRTAYPQTWLGPGQGTGRCS